MNNFTGNDFTIIASLISLITTFGYIIKWFIKSESRIIVDILLDLRFINLWDKFASTLFLSAIMSCTMLIMIFAFNYTIIATPFFVILWGSVFVVCCIILIIFFIKSLFKKAYSKVLNKVVAIHFLTLIFLPYIIIDSMKKEIIDHLSRDYIMLTLSIIFLIFYVFVMLRISLSVLTYFKGYKKDNFKIESIKDIDEKLNQLYFLFMYDNERHVMSGTADVKKLEEGFYIFYPKEKVLIRYYKV